jgi:hypothetical protein
MRNAQKYRPPLKRTVDSFINDKDKITRPNHALGQQRHTQVRRDQDTVKGPNVTLYDIDFGVKSFFENVIQPKVVENDTVIDVPIFYMNSEKWSDVQKRGYIRDKKGKMLIPVIAFRRASVEVDQQLKRNKVSPVEDLYYLSEAKYNKNFRYDQFSVQTGMQRPSEFYLIQPPDYVKITYEFQFWCEYQTQLNELIETMIFYQGQSFGDKNSYKFRSYVDSYAIDNVTDISDDRVVRSSFNITTYGYLVRQQVNGEVVTKRRLSTKKIVFDQEIVSDLDTQFRENKKGPNDKKYYTDILNEGNF